MSVLSALGLPRDRLPRGRRRASHPPSPLLRRLRASVHHGRGSRPGGRQAQWRHRAVQPREGREWRPARLPGQARRRGRARPTRPPRGGDRPGRGRRRGPQPRGRARHPRSTARARRGGVPPLRERLSLVLLHRRLREGDRRSPPPRRRYELLKPSSPAGCPTPGRRAEGRTMSNPSPPHVHSASATVAGHAALPARHRRQRRAEPQTARRRKRNSMTEIVGTTHGSGAEGSGAPGSGGRGKKGAGGAKRPGLTIERIHTTPGVHPYDEVTWERRDVVMTNWRDGSVNFEQRGVEFPQFWSINATNIVTSKYFRGAVGSPHRESSLRQLIDRVVTVYLRAGREHGYFATEADAEVFGHELTWMLLHQVFSFNSPVWFNVGTTSPQQVSACFILAVDDTMESILNWYREEGLIFKGGSGSGLNLSRIRSSKELLSSGGTASGPVSFMRGADASAGTIKSGGATRRAAKMVVLDVDHPDIEEFVLTKSKEEAKIRVLRDAGFDMDLGGSDITSVQYQNANNSVRVTDEFMRAVESDAPFGLRARMTGDVIETVGARKLFRTIAQAAWECADPGIQYDGTINDWHTCPESGRISASNPCSEYMHLDNSSCNLASLNLLTFLGTDGQFDAARFQKCVELIITAMDISICFADFPTEPIGDTTRKFRQLGIGYANLGALLMATGHAYDSEGGRSLAAAITSLMTGAAYKRSAELAGVVGPYQGFARNAESHQRVMRKHAAANDDVRTFPSSAPIHRLATSVWQECLQVGSRNGWRNAQASVLAPTGTIGW